MTGLLWVAGCLCWPSAAAAQQPIQVKPDGLGFQDRFGYAVTASGNDLYVAAPFQDVAQEDSGALYHLVRSPRDADQWSVAAKLFDPAAQTGDELGFSIDVEDDVLVVGIEDHQQARGGAAVYTRMAGVWGNQRILAPRERRLEDSFGISVALDDERIVLGSLRGWGFGQPATAAGAVAVFDRGPDDQWLEVGLLEAEDAQIGDTFGLSVDLVSGWLAVGAPGAGAAYLFRPNGLGSWVQHQKLTLPGNPVADRFGWSLSLGPSAGTLLVGAPGTNGGVGAVWFYRREGNTFVQDGQVGGTVASGQFGWSTKLHDTMAIVGAPFTADRGAAFLLEKSPGWQVVAQISAPPNQASGALFGWSVALGGGNAVIGAPAGGPGGSPGSPTETGSVWLFRLQDLLPNRCFDQDPRVLCAYGGRFRVEGTFVRTDGSTADARVGDSKSNDSGVFWFFRPDNWELMIKVLDGCGVNNRFWVFLSGVTNVGYELRVTDLVTGAVWRGSNPPNTTSRPILDTSALGGC